MISYSENPSDQSNHADGSGLVRKDLPSQLTVFMFPLPNIVFFPHTNMPLNIYEPRYLTMVKDAIETNTPIALGLPDSTVTGIGTPRVIETRPDGTQLIILQGIGKVRLVQTLSTTPYLTCYASLIQETQVIQSQYHLLMLELNRAFGQWLAKHIPHDEIRHVVMKQVVRPEEILESLAMYLIPDSEMRQMVLECNDINEKIKLITSLLDIQITHGTGGSAHLPS